MGTGAGTLATANKNVEREPEPGNEASTRAHAITSTCMYMYEMINGYIL